MKQVNMREYEGTSFQDEAVSQGLLRALRQGGVNQIRPELEDWYKRTLNAGDAGIKIEQKLLHLSQYRHTQKTAKSSEPLVRAINRVELMIEENKTLFTNNGVIGVGSDGFAVTLANKSKVFGVYFYSEFTNQEVQLLVESLDKYLSSFQIKCCYFSLEQLNQSANRLDLLPVFSSQEATNIWCSCAGMAPLFYGNPLFNGGIQQREMMNRMARQQIQRFSILEATLLLALEAVEHGDVGFCTEAMHGKLN